MAKRLAALMLAALMLTGCAGLSVKPQRPEAPKLPAPEPPPARELTVYDPLESLAPVLEQYSQSQGVTVTKAESPDTAQLAVFGQQPGPAAARDLTQSEGLVRVLAPEGPCYGFSLGSASYGYVADADLLKALLEDAGEAETVQKMSSQEWQSFTQALAGWLEKGPARQYYNLKGVTWYLPAKKEGAAAGLKAVFSVEGERIGTPLLAPVLGTCYKTEEEFSAAGQRSNLMGGLNSLYTLLGQEAASFSEGGLEAFAKGETVFCRTTLESARAACGKEKNLVLIPMKYSFDSTDLHGGLSLAELLNQPVQVSGGWLGIPAGTQQPQEAEAFLLWAVASEEGRKIPHDQGPQAPGMPDIARAISPEGMEKLIKLGREQQDWSREGRRAFTTAAMAVLNEEGAKADA